MFEPLMKVGDLARYLRINRITLYGWAKTGKIPAYRIGGRWKFNKTEIDTWLKAARVAQNKLGVTNGK